MQKSSDTLFPSISVDFTYTATRVIFLYLIYMSLPALTICEATLLIELCVKFLAWHLKLSSFCPPCIPYSYSFPMCTELFSHRAMVWSFCCPSLCFIFQLPFLTFEKLIHLHNVQIQSNVHETLESP